MKDEISFMTGKFVSTIPEHSEGHRYGEDLANWMALRSKDTEFKFSAAEKTDLGWSEMVTVGNESFQLGFTIGKDTRPDYSEWHVTISGGSGWNSSRSVGTGGRSRLCDHVYNVLRDERQVRELQWV